MREFFTPIIILAGLSWFGLTQVLAIWWIVSHVNSGLDYFGLFARICQGG